MPVVVAIDVPAESPVELVSATLRSCNTALGEGRCQLDDGTERRDVVFHAVVRWDSAGLELHIELRDRHAGGQLLEQREVLFSEDDAARLRWASAGLVIASLAVQHERPPEPLTPTPIPLAPVPAPAPAPLPPPSEPEFEPRVLFDVGAQLGTALEDSEPRLGPFLGVVVPLGSLPLQIMAGAAYTMHSGEPETTWLAGALGLGVRIGSWKSPWAAELRSELLVEQVTLKAEEPSSNTTDESSRVRLGSSLGLGMVWTPTRYFGLVLGAKATVMRPEIVVVIRDEAAGSVPAFGWTSWGGARLAW
jgi:hypothetical protein